MQIAEGGGVSYGGEGEESHADSRWRAEEESHTNRRRSLIQIGHSIGRYALFTFDVHFMAVFT